MFFSPPFSFQGSLTNTVPVFSRPTQLSPTPPSPQPSPVVSAPPPPGPTRRFERVVLSKRLNGTKEESLGVAGGFGHRRTIWDDRHIDGRPGTTGRENGFESTRRFRTGNSSGVRMVDGCGERSRSGGQVLIQSEEVKKEQTLLRWPFSWMSNKTHVFTKST